MFEQQANIKTAAGTVLALDAAKALGKGLPLGIGSIIAGISGISRLPKGDYLGAGIDFASAATSPFLTPVALGLDAINFARDMSRNGESTPQEQRRNRFIAPDGGLQEESPEYRFINNPMNKTAQAQKKAANSQFRQDLTNPSAGADSDLYKAIEPMISSNSDAMLRGADAERINALKEQVRKGMVGLEYMTGLKKNTGETFYDKHPVEATTTDLLGNAAPLGAGVAGAGILANMRRQRSNMLKTEPAKMSRSENSHDTTNPANLLDPHHGPARSDVSRLFGDLENNPEKRLALLDQLSGSDPGDPNSFLGKHKNIQGKQKELIDAHNLAQQDIQNKLSGATTKPEVAQLEALMRSGDTTHKASLAKLEQETKKLMSAAKSHGDNAGLHKYVNLHESLRRAREKGGLKSYIGEGLSSLGGVGDLLEKYHITGANPHYNEEIIKNIVSEYGGSHTSPEEMRKFIEGTLQRIGDPHHQASGLRKAFSRAKIPLAAGAATAAGGMGLYHLLKGIQNQNYSKGQTAEWKKTLLKSRGDFDAAKRVEEEQQATQPR